MQNKKKKQTLIKISIIVIALVIIVIIATNADTISNTITSTFSSKNKNKEPVVNTDVSLLKGTFIYNDEVKYEFNENNTGALYDKNNKYEYTYKIHDQQVTLTFNDTTIHESTYTFYFVDDDLKLIGGEGTVGGEYILKKEK